MKTMHNSNYHKRNNYFTGLFFVVVGVVLLINKLNIIPDFLSNIIFTWQALLIFIGIISIAKQNYTFGGMMIVIGGFFLIPEIIPFAFKFTYLFWPVLLIFAGIFIILKRNNRVHRSQKFRRHFDRINFTETSNDAIDEEVIFGGLNRKVVTNNFTGGKISTIFGGVELDLTASQLAPGTQVLQIEAIFGGIKLRVPDNWNVVVDVKMVLGGFDDKRMFGNDYTLEGKNTLIIKGEAIFGGGEVYN